MGDMLSSSSSTKTKLPGYANNFYKDLFKDAKRAYNQGPYAYEGSTVTPFSDQTRAGLTNLSGIAQANMNGKGMSGPLQNILNNGGFNDGQLRSMAGMESLANNPFFSQTINSNGLSEDQNSVAARYRNEMNSPFDLNANPAYASVRQNALDTQRQGVTANAALSGRFGGGANQNILARNQGQLGSQMDMGEYRNWQQRGDAAASGLSNLSQQGFNNRSNAVAQQSGLQNNLFNAQQAGLGNMGQAYQTLRMPAQDMMAVGGQYEDLYSRNMQDELRRFDAQNPFNQFQQYASLLQGAPRGQTTTQSMSPFQALTGGLLAGSAFL